MYVCIYIYIYIYVVIVMCVYLSLLLSLSLYEKKKYIYIYIYTYIYTYAYIYIYIYSYISNPGWPTCRSRPPPTGRVSRMRAGPGPSHASSCLRPALHRLYIYIYIYIYIAFSQPVLRSDRRSRMARRGKLSEHLEPQTSSQPSVDLSQLAL